MYTTAIDPERVAKRALYATVNIIDAFRNWRQRRQDARQAQAEKEINARFDIEHREGRMFLTCEGTAFSEIPGNCTVEQASALLRAAREQANSFKSLTSL